MVLSFILVIFIVCLAYWNEDIAWEYCSPFVIILSLCIFMIFQKIDIGSIKIVNEMSGSVFTCFLIHGYFIPHINIEFFATKNVIVMILHIMISSIIIYFVSYLVWKAYIFIYKMLTDRIDKSKLDFDFYK